MKSAALSLCNLKPSLIPLNYEFIYHADLTVRLRNRACQLEEELGFRFRSKVLPGLTIANITFQKCENLLFGREILLFPGVSGATVIGLEQRFSNFFQVGTTFISQNVLRTTLLLGLSTH